MTAFAACEWITYNDLICIRINLRQLFMSIDSDEDSICSRIVLAISGTATKRDRRYALIRFRIDHSVSLAMKIRNVNLICFARIRIAVRVIAGWDSSEDTETLIVNYN